MADDFCKLIVLVEIENERTVRTILHLGVLYGIGKWVFDFVYRWIDEIYLYGWIKPLTFAAVKNE